MIDSVDTVDTADTAEPPTVPAVFVGETRQPLTLNGAKCVVPSLRSLDQWMLQDLVARDRPAPAPAGLTLPAERSETDSPNALLQHVQRSTAAAFESSAKIHAVVDAAAGPGALLRSLLRGEATRNSQPGAGPAAFGHYPEYQLAKTLHTVAQLIRADLGIRIFCVELGGDGFGGFDNHANQIGNHCSLLLQLSESLGAFVDDLRRDGLLDRTLLMTFSEFGRTIAENGRRGTDHGAAAPVFLAGGRLQGGLHGEPPSLTTPEKGGLTPHTDFRHLYATVLDRWLGFDSQICLGEQFPTLDLLRIDAKCRVGPASNAAQAHHPAQNSQDATTGASPLLRRDAQIRQSGRANRQGRNTAGPAATQRPDFPACVCHAENGEAPRFSEHVAGFDLEVFVDQRGGERFGKGIQHEHAAVLQVGQYLVAPAGDVGGSAHCGRAEGRAGSCDSAASNRR